MYQIWRQSNQWHMWKWSSIKENLNNDICFISEDVKYVINHTVTDESNLMSVIQTLSMQCIDIKAVKKNFIFLSLLDATWYNEMERSWWPGPNIKVTNRVSRHYEDQMSWHYYHIFMMGIPILVRGHPTITAPPPPHYLNMIWQPSLLMDICIILSNWVLSTKHQFFFYYYSSSYFSQSFPTNYLTVIVTSLINKFMLWCPFRVNVRYWSQITSKFLL